MAGEGGGDVTLPPLDSARSLEEDESARGTFNRRADDSEKTRNLKDKDSSQTQLYVSSPPSCDAAPRTNAEPKISRFSDQKNKTKKKAITGGPGFRGLLQQWLHSHARHSVSLTRGPRIQTIRGSDGGEAGGSGGAREPLAAFSRRANGNRAATNTRDKREGNKAIAFKHGIHPDGIPPSLPTFPDRPRDDISKYFPRVLIKPPCDRFPGVRWGNG